MNLALSESLGLELRFAKRINSNGVTELKLWTKEVQIQICLKSNFKTFKNMFKLDYWIEEIMTKRWVLVSLDLDWRVKSYGYLKNQGQAVLRGKK